MTSEIFSMALPGSTAAIVGASASVILRPALLYPPNEKFMKRDLMLLTTHIQERDNPETVNGIWQAKKNLFDLKPVWLRSGIRQSTLQ
jgi:hypothetical protein